jgi:hypothetical protein
MLNLSLPLTFSAAGSIPANELIASVEAFCKSGQNIHQETLKTVVLKLTYFSRDMKLNQKERDTAADFANHLANAAIRKYGKTSAFAEDLITSVNLILKQRAA